MRIGSMRLMRVKERKHLTPWSRVRSLQHGRHDPASDEDFIETRERG